MSVKKAAKPIDAQVGARVRMSRRTLGMTQEDLGNALGVTFQQVQKYEKGMNRIGAGRLQDIANILGVTVSSFFEAPSHGDTPQGDTSQSDALQSATAQSVTPQCDVLHTDISDFIASGDGLALVRSFARISDAKVRRRVVRLVEELSISADYRSAD